MELWTIQIAKHRLAKEKGIFFLDTTVKSGERTFAPVWSMVIGHKEGTVSDQAYTDLYYDMMRNTYRKVPNRWLAVLAMQKVAIACYCPEGAFCHRHLLADMLIKLGARKGIPVTFHGELSSL